MRVLVQGAFYDLMRLGCALASPRDVLPLVERWVTLSVWPLGISRSISHLTAVVVEQSLQSQPMLLQTLSAVTIFLF